jgi:hypothetical protein
MISQTNQAIGIRGKNSFVKTSACTQKKAYNIKVHTVTIICLFMFISCKPLEMFSHTESGTDTYCIYKITSVKNTGNEQALKKGDIICLYCNKVPSHCEFYNQRWIKVYKVTGGDPTRNSVYLKTDLGISYYLESDDPLAPCTGCPGANKFQLLPN